MAIIELQADLKGNSGTSAGAGLRMGLQANLRGHANAGQAVKNAPQPPKQQV